MHSVFTIFYEGPYWVGVLERFDAEGYWVGRHIFGGEPSNAELIQFLANSFDTINVSLSTGPHPDSEQAAVVPNAKRALRISRKEQGKGLDSYTHIALQIQLKDSKLTGKAMGKLAAEAAVEMKFQIKAAKRKKKKRGH